MSYLLNCVVTNLKHKNHTIFMWGNQAGDWNWIQPRWILRFESINGFISLYATCVRQLSQTDVLFQTADYILLISLLYRTVLGLKKNYCLNCACRLRASISCTLCCRALIFFLQHCRDRRSRIRHCGQSKTHPWFVFSTSCLWPLRRLSLLSVPQRGWNQYFQCNVWPIE